MARKLELKKKTISILSNDDLKIMNGGEAAPVTTSFGQCTGWACCSPTESVGITIEISIAISIATQF